MKTPRPVFSRRFPFLAMAACLVLANSSRAQTSQTPQQWAEAEQKAREAEWARQKAEQERQAAERQRREAERVAAQEKIRLEQLAARERQQQQFAETQRRIQENTSRSSNPAPSTSGTYDGDEHLRLIREHNENPPIVTTSPPSVPRTPRPAPSDVDRISRDYQNALDASPPAPDLAASGRQALDAFVKAVTANTPAIGSATRPSSPGLPSTLPAVDPESGLVPWDGRDPYGFDTPDAYPAPKPQRLGPNGYPIDETLPDRPDFPAPGGTSSSTSPSRVNSDGMVMEFGPTPYDIPPLDPPPPPAFDPADDGRAYVWNQEEQLYYKAVRDWQQRFDSGSATYRDHPDRLGMAATEAGKKSDPSWGGITQKGDTAYAYWDALRRRDATTARDIQTERDLSAGLVRANLSSDQERYIRVFAMSRAQQQADLTGLSMHAVMDMDGPAYRAKVDALRHSADALARKYQPATTPATPTDRAIDQVLEKTRRDWYAANHHKYAEPVPKHATPYDRHAKAFRDALNPPPKGPNPALVPAAKPPSP